MIITYLRSSSYGGWSFCQQQYFLTYVLGYQSTSGLKADKGTVVHKVLEILANCKQVLQNDPLQTEGKRYLFEDSQIGDVYFSSSSLFSKTVLDDEKVDWINKTRVNKYNYCYPCKLEYGHTRYGVELVESLIQACYDFYVEGSPHDWKPVDFKDITNWVWMALDYKGGMFDPRKRDIVSPEPHFDFVIDEPWAKYEWNVNGKKVAGKLAIKGTVDLITKLDDNLYEIVDWKTGSRVDWNTPNKDRKTYKKLIDDFQLDLYHYAASRLYPDIDQIITSIFFVRDGGPFTVCKDRSDIDKTLDNIKNRFKEIVKCQKPQMIDPFQKCDKCAKFCAFYKMKSPDGKDNLCSFINKQVDKYGIDEVVANFTQPGFSVGQYNAPGEK